MASCFPTKEKGDKKTKQGAVPNGESYPQAGSPEETPKSEQPRTLETSKSKADLKREESERKSELKRQESMRKKQEKDEKKKMKGSSSRSLSASSSSSSFTLPPGAIQLAPGQALPPGYVIITPGQPLPTNAPAQTVAPGASAPAQAVTQANASAPATVPAQVNTTVVSTPAVAPPVAPAVAAAAGAPSTFTGAAAPASQEDAPRSMAKSPSATSPPTHIPIAVDSPLASPIATSVTPLSTEQALSDADTPVIPRATSPDDAVELARPSGAVQTQSFAASSSVPAEVGQQTTTAVVISQLAPHGESASTPVVPGIAAVLPAEPVSSASSSTSTVVNEASFNTNSVVAEPARVEGEKAPTSGEHPTEFEATVSIKSDEPQLDIAGEFTNWERRPMMAESTEQGRVHKYFVSLPRDRALEKPRWMFKFVSGDRWFHDISQPSWNDNGNENNYVSTEQFK